MEQKFSISKRNITVGLALFLTLAFISSVLAQEPKSIKLPEPKLGQAVTLAQALKDRKTMREYGPGNLTEQTLSNLLWAAWGINRPESGRRTAPSALNRQEMDVYVTTSEGTYLYDAKENSLIAVASGDIRAMTGKQSYFKDAAINLVYVADFARMDAGDDSHRTMVAALDTGFIAQNVYLYCAAEGLATVFRISIDKPKLAELLKLRPDQRIMGAHTVGLRKQK